MSDLQSRPYQPNAAKCCDACVFGAGEHAEWCGSRLKAWMEMHQASNERIGAISCGGNIVGLSGDGKRRDCLACGDCGAPLTSVDEMAEHFRVTVATVQRWRDGDAKRFAKYFL